MPSTTISSLALSSNHHQQQQRLPNNSIKQTNRSRSLDGLLDCEIIDDKKNITNNPSDIITTTKSCDDLDNKQTENVTTMFNNCVDNHLDCDNLSDKTSISSESKRKRNFMDRCVNKVRSLIKK